MTAEIIPKLDDRYSTAVQEYVEIIRDLVADNHVARVKDIARKRGVTQSSVSTALNTLSDLGLVNHEHYGYVTLSEDGVILGEILAQRHSVILKFLRDCLRIDPELADNEACRLEHAVSLETLDALIRFVREAEKCQVCIRFDEAER